MSPVTPRRIPVRIERARKKLEAIVFENHDIAFLAATRFFLRPGSTPHLRLKCRVNPTKIAVVSIDKPRQPAFRT